MFLIPMRFIPDLYDGGVISKIVTSLREADILVKSLADISEILGIAEDEDEDELESIFRTSNGIPMDDPIYGVPSPVVAKCQAGEEGKVNYDSVDDIHYLFDDPVIVDTPPVSPVGEMMNFLNPNRINWNRVKTDDEIRRIELKQKASQDRLDELLMLNDNPKSQGLGYSGRFSKYYNRFKGYIYSLYCKIFNIDPGFMVGSVIIVAAVIIACKLYKSFNKNVVSVVETDNESNDVAALEDKKKKDTNRANRRSAKQNSKKRYFSQDYKKDWEERTGKDWVDEDDYEYDFDYEELDQVGKYKMDFIGAGRDSANMEHLRPGKAINNVPYFYRVRGTDSDNTFKNANCYTYGDIVIVPRHLASKSVCLDIIVVVNGSEKIVALKGKGRVMKSISDAVSFKLPTEFRKSIKSNRNKFRVPLAGEFATVHFYIEDSYNQYFSCGEMGEQRFLGKDQSISVWEFDGSTRSGCCGSAVISARDGAVIGFCGIGFGNVNTKPLIYPCSAAFVDEIRSLCEGKQVFEYDPIVDVSYVEYYNKEIQIFGGKKNLVVSFSEEIDLKTKGGQN
jgi:hypothetical protein